MTLTIAIVGRPNVGKSTLFNKLTATNHALVDNRPGITRDWREGYADFAGMRFCLIDTPGFHSDRATHLEARMREQTQTALLQAQMLFFVIDGRAGILPDDSEMARLLRKRNIPIIAIANKCEGAVAHQIASDSWRLGLGDVIPLSAAHGDGFSDLFDAIYDMATQLGCVDDIFNEPSSPSSRDSRPSKQHNAQDADTQTQTIRIAVVGRPNMGKSTLVNAFLGERRLLTGPEAGITHDSITVPFTWKQKLYHLVDTAGIRRRARIIDKVEKLIVGDAERSVNFAQICILMLDAREPPHKQDISIARYIADEGRALVIAANMWDAVEDKSSSLRQIQDRLQRSLAQLRGIPVIPISALHGDGLDPLMQACEQIYDVWTTRISTAMLNRWIAKMLEAHPPPMIQGRRLRIRYMTQIRTRPPTFALFASKIEEMPESYLRYLTSGLRTDFHLQAVPIRMVLRKNENPYVK